MAKSALIIDQLWKDAFPASGDPNDSPEYIKRWRAERVEIERIGKRIAVPPHEDNCGAPCREVGPTSLVYDLQKHDCCGFCNDLGEQHADKETP